MQFSEAVARSFIRPRRLMRGGITTLLALALIGGTVFASFSPARASAAGTSGSNSVYFPETGQYLGAPFLTYWQQHGGVTTFGYPISGELKENDFTVQYFQRAVFEYHSDAPAGWTIQLRLLGDAYAANMRNDASFRPIVTTSDADCTFYAVTGHPLCSLFRTYWQDHGGLRVFGYPISQEIITGSNVIVQYFERARFEYHPNNPVKYQVELGLLGTWAASQDHIDTAPQPGPAAIGAGSGFFITGAGNGADWALTATQLYVTTDDGATWSSTPLPVGVGVSSSNYADDAAVDPSGALWLVSNHGNVVSFYRATHPDSPWSQTSVTLTWPSVIDDDQEPTPDEIFFGSDAPGIVTAVVQEEGTQSGPASLVLISTDNGRTFQQHNPPTTFGRWDTAFISASAGIIVGDGYYGTDRGNTGTDFRSAVYYTTNGGASWHSAIIQGVDQSLLTYTTFSTPLVSGIHIYIAATLLTPTGGQHLQLYASNDGGKTFVLKESVIGPNTAKGAWTPLLGVNGANIWMLLDGSGTFYKSSNNGTTWTAVSSAVLQADLFPGIDLMSSSDGGVWVLNYNCTGSDTGCLQADEFLATADGGHHWQVEASHTTPLDPEALTSQPPPPICIGPSCPPR